jgi:hypothetical protein
MRTFLRDPAHARRRDGRRARTILPARTAETTSIEQYIRCLTQACAPPDFGGETKRTRCTSTPAAVRDTVCEELGWVEPCWADDLAALPCIGRNAPADDAQPA